MTKRKWISEVQFQRDYDVIVVGGGTTGACAALAAAREGAKTAVVEYYGFLGGNATSGLPWMAFHNYEERKLLIRGIPLEIIERLRRIGGATDFFLDPILESTVGVNTTLLKMMLAEMIKEEGVDPYLHSLAVGVEKKADTVEGVYIQNKQGCQFLGAPVIIDCTDTGDICVMAGAGFEIGRRHDGKTQVASTVFTIGDVDMEAFISYFEKHPGQMRPHLLPPKDLEYVISNLRKTPLFSMGAFRELVAKSISEGVKFPRETLVGVAFPKIGEIMLVTPRIQNVDANDVMGFSMAESEGYSQINEIMKFVHDYMPGGAKARIVGSGHQIGLRESRHILGDYYLTGEDLSSGRKFADVVVLGAYFFDIHTPDHTGLAPMVQPPTYQIPYRCLLPKGLEGLLVAGRCISASHEALSAVRVIPISAAQGQAAGTAAALTVKQGITPRAVDISELQDTLKQAGAELGQGL